MVLPPFYLKTDADGLMHYFDAISRAVSIPIMVQDAPLMTQVPMPAALLARMAKEIERVVYAKVEAPPTAPKVSAVIRAGGPVRRRKRGPAFQNRYEEVLGIAASERHGAGNHFIRRRLLRFRYCFSELPQKEFAVMMQIAAGFCFS